MKSISSLFLKFSSIQKPGARWGGPYGGWPSSGGVAMAPKDAEAEKLARLRSLREEAAALETELGLAPPT